MPNAMGRITTNPMRNTSHERSVSDSNRPNSRSACTAGMRGSRSAAGIPINSRDQLRRQAPTGPKTLFAAVHDSYTAVPGGTSTAPARNRANSNSAIPQISRLRGVFPTGLLPLAVWSELRDLPVVVDRYHGMCVHLGANDEILGEARFGERAPVLRILEQAIEPISIAFVDEGAGLRGVVEPCVGELAGDCARESAGTCRILERELPIATGAHDGHVSRAAGSHPNHRRYRRIVDVRCNDYVTCALNSSERDRAVRRRQEDCLSFDRLRGVLA